jgi:alkylhydroperoxidase family enzyme
MIGPVDAEGDLARTYQEIGATRGGVAHILQIQSLHPKALKAHFDLYRALMFGASPLSRAERELVATVVSSENGCHY